MRDEEKTLATVSHGVSAGALLLSFGMVGWLIPLIIFFTNRHKSRFVAFHALQSVYLHTGIFLVNLALVIIATMTLGFLSPITGLAALLLVGGGVFFEIMAAIRAKEGKWYGIPVAGAWTRNTLGDP
jgi:uncharacterized membrane protein